MIENHFYICKQCERKEGDAEIFDGNEGPCLLIVDASPGIPTECPFGLGFTSDWIEVDEERFRSSQLSS